MDGLECNEIYLSAISHWNPSLRFDAEFFNKEAIMIDDRIRSGHHYCVDKEQVVSGPFGSTLKSESYLVSGDVPFIRIENIRGGFYINPNEIVFISNHDNNRIKNSELQVDDIVLSKVGNTIGFFARVDERLSICNISENNIGIKMSKYPKPQRKYILTYLNSKYAQTLVKRRTSGNAQPKLNVGDVCLIPIPAFSDTFYNIVAQLIDESEKSLVRAEKCYKDAENVLSNTLNIQEISQNPPVKSEKQLTESFLLTGRLDAEYYQPKYDYYKAWITSYKSGFSLIREEFEQVVDNCTRTKTEYPYVEIGDVDVKSGEASFNTISTELLPANAKIMTCKGDILVSTVRPNRGAVAILDTDDLLVSGAFTVLRQKGNYKKEVLQTLLRSVVYQDWLLRYNVGTSYPVIKDENVLNMPIPLFDPDVQNSIAAKVQESFALRKQSKHLLEYAKQAVEMAIEQGEDVALEWLNSKIKME